MSISVLDTYAGPPRHEVDEDAAAVPPGEPRAVLRRVSRSDVELAKALCLDCPVRAECLAGALERREPWGVWGGELFLQGVVIPRKRPRGRPRKNDVAA